MATVTPPPLPEQFTNITTSQPPPYRYWHYGANEQADASHHTTFHGVGVLMVAVLSLALFLTLLFLYSRWACGRSHRSPTAASTSNLNDQAFFSSTVPSGLSERYIEELPVRAHSTGGGGEEVECPICLTRLVVGEMVKVLPRCKHAFHPDCVGEWLRERPTCPLCRESLVGLPTKVKEVEPPEVV